MSRSLKQSAPRRPRRARQAASWLALVAATTLGAASVKQVRVLSPDRAAQVAASHDWRLIVQSYDPADVTSVGVPRRGARPVASAQRAVTREQLSSGVSVDLIELEVEQKSKTVVVAWVEPGTADLEFDARRARPGNAVYLGVAYGASERRRMPIALRGA